MSHKVKTLVEILEADRGTAYALGWLSSVLSNIGRDINLTSNQSKQLQDLLDANIQWARSYSN